MSTFPTLRRFLILIGCAVALTAAYPSLRAASADQAPAAVATQGADASTSNDSKSDPKKDEQPAKSEDGASTKPAAAPAADKPAEDAKKDAKPEAKADKPAAEAEKKADKPEAKSTDSKPADKPAEKSSDKPATKSADKAAVTKSTKVRLAQFILKDDLPEAADQSSPFGDLKLNLSEMVSRIDKASDDKSISGAILDIRSPSIGRGKIQEIRAAVQRFRAKGKKMYAQLESAEPADYLVACACNEIAMPESGVVVLPGIHAEATFYKQLLEKLGIQADFIHIGDYKGAAEPLTRENFSEPVRENMTSLIDGLYDEMVTTIVKDRPLSVDQVKEIIDNGILTAKRAKEAGLIDRVAYADALRDELAKSYEADPLVYVENYGQKKVDTDFSGPMGFMKLMQLIAGGNTSNKKDHGKKIAVVYAVGPITSGKSQSDPFGGEIMGSTTIVEALRKANDDKLVAAIVLRIDSPGGSALASDLIWHETQVIDKPIVASMGDVAGSGGYYIAMGADKIIATPGTITGSIGVVGGKLAIRGLFKKIGVTTETIERGRNSGIFGSSGPWTDSQRKIVQDMMQDIYGQFTSKAAEGRHMPLEKLQSLAGGRIYTGRQALANGLIDQLGTLDDAVNAAKQLAGIEKDTDVTIERLPEPTNFFESLFGELDAEKEVRLGPALAPLAPELTEAARQVYQLRAVFDQPAALVMPFGLEIH